MAVCKHVGNLDAGGRRCSTGVRASGASGFPRAHASRSSWTRASRVEPSASRAPTNGMGERDVTTAAPSINGSKGLGTGAEGGSEGATSGAATGTVDPIQPLSRFASAAAIYPSGTCGFHGWFGGGQPAHVDGGMVSAQNKSGGATCAATTGTFRLGGVGGDGAFSNRSSQAPSQK